jgi:hypothetical protein
VLSAVISLLRSKTVMIAYVNEADQNMTVFAEAKASG